MLDPPVNPGSGRYPQGFYGSDNKISISDPFRLGKTPGTRFPKVFTFFTTPPVGEASGSYFRHFTRVSTSRTHRRIWRLIRLFRVSYSPGPAPQLSSPVPSFLPENPVSS